VPLPRPVAAAPRADLAAWILRRAGEAGALTGAERVVDVDSAGRIRTSAGRAESFDVVVGADGAGSLVGRKLLRPRPPERPVMATGWFAPGTSPMLVRFTPGLPGYLWLFPRRDHVGVGICAPLGSVATRMLMGRLAAGVPGPFPAFTPPH